MIKFSCNLSPLFDLWGNFSSCVMIGCSIAKTICDIDHIEMAFRPCVVACAPWDSIGRRIFSRKPCMEMVFRLCGTAGVVLDVFDPWMTRYICRMWTVWFQCGGEYGHLSWWINWTSCHRCRRQTPSHSSGSICGA